MTVTHYPVSVDVHGRAELGVLDVLFDINDVSPLHVSLTIDQCHILRHKLSGRLYPKEKP